MLILAIDPMGKPRMTRADSWKKRPCVEKYWAFKDELRKQAGAWNLPESFGVKFLMPMPKSWSKKKRIAMIGEPHQQKPDIDNLEKALLDAFLDDDSGVWRLHSEKRWAVEGQIMIYPVPIPMEDEIAIKLPVL